MSCLQSNMLAEQHRNPLKAPNAAAPTLCRVAILLHALSSNMRAQSPTPSLSATLPRAWLRPHASIPLCLPCFELGS